VPTSGLGVAGGAFGPEASLVAVAVCLALGILFLRVAQAKGPVLRPSWRRVRTAG
jgi:ABC-type Co2+ transport system permease subunit